MRRQKQKQKQNLKRSLTVFLFLTASPAFATQNEVTYVFPEGVIGDKAVEFVLEDASLKQIGNQALLHFRLPSEVVGSESESKPFELKGLVKADAFQLMDKQSSIADCKLLIAATRCQISFKDFSQVKQDAALIPDERASHQPIGVILFPFRLEESPQEN